MSLFGLFGGRRRKEPELYILYGISAHDIADVRRLFERAFKIAFERKDHSDLGEYFLHRAEDGVTIRIWTNEDPLGGGLFDFVFPDLSHFVELGGPKTAVEAFEPRMKAIRGLRVLRRGKEPANPQE